MRSKILKESELIAAKKQLRDDFTDYLRNNSPTAIGKNSEWFKKCFKHIVGRIAEIDNIAPIEESALKEIPRFKKYTEQIGLKVGEMMNMGIFFCDVPAEQYYPILNFVKRYKELSEIKLDKDSRSIYKATKEEEIDKIVDKYYADDREYLANYEYFPERVQEFVIIVYRRENFVDAKAFNFGGTDLLPQKDRKYVGQGELRYKYPLSSLDSLKGLHAPIIEFDRLLR